MAKTMILQPIFLAYLALFLLVSSYKSDRSTEPRTDAGFTVDLVHRDSIRSRFHSLPASHPQRRLDAIRRSFQNVRRVNSKNSTLLPRPVILNSYGEYIMKYSIGTPPVPTLGLIDTGSDLVWTQCRPCRQCFDQTLTLFAPNNSSTYKRIPCQASACTSLKMMSTHCTETTSHCRYSEKFDDGSFTEGEVSTDTITFFSIGGKKVVSAPNFTIGCGFSNNGIFVGGESGVVGLGGGNASLVRQLGSLARGKFSYCLVPQFVDNDTIVYSGKLSFGAEARVSGKGVVSTPLVHKDPQTYYFLTLEGISVGDKRVDFHDSLSAESKDSEKGNIMIDSGTTLTFLRNNSYVNLVKGLENEIELERIKDPLGKLGLCFATAKDDIDFPRVVFHFERADVELKQENVFYRTSNVSLCLAAMPVPNDDIGIYGNLAQMNFWVGYDLEKRTVSFKPTHWSTL